ncbi:MAG: monovalent cation/H(+) antiporter subunit G [Bacteroidota bacterium]|nr:monovalent cation/H(+) antiporter subunit G [Bacteroidota bacterium]
MENIVDIIGALVTLIGSIFLFLGSLGLIRMPDIYNRIQTGTKASTLGAILTLLGIIIIMPEWWGRLLLLMLFILITNPVSSHVLARAAHFIKIPLTKDTVIDKLEYKYKENDNGKNSEKDINS